MNQRIGYVSLLVRDYDEAIAYYTGVLGFWLVEDTPLAPGKRWVLVAPPSATSTASRSTQTRMVCSLMSRRHRRAFG
jgi:catechol 2,3-dioxygenase-like lactoylglutathione lyase family enzyme